MRRIEQMRAKIPQLIVLFIRARLLALPNRRPAALDVPVIMELMFDP
jgi:hypothetical protein